MATARIQSGICGFQTTVNARMDGSDVVLEIHSDCDAIQKLAAELTRVDPFQEISFRGAGPQTLNAARRYCRHPACPVPSGILKAAEVAAGLALPADVVIHVTKEE